MCSFHATKELPVARNAKLQPMYSLPEGVTVRWFWHSIKVLMNSRSKCLSGLVFPSSKYIFQFLKHKGIYLENINLILAFIINIISQPIEHLNISSAFIVKRIRKCTLYFFLHNRCIYRYQLPGWLSGLHTYIFKLCVVSSNPVRDIYYCNFWKDLFLFLLNFLLLQYRFSILINLISLMTITFSRRIRNTVLQLSPATSSVFKIWASTWDFQQCGILTRIGTGELVHHF